MRKMPSSFRKLFEPHVLAGNPLPTVWIPDAQTRDDREAVRCRLDAAEKLTALKAQVKSLLKRNQLTKPEAVGKSWTKPYWAWLRGLIRDPGTGVGLRTSLASLLRQLDYLDDELERLDQALLKLSHSARYHGRGDSLGAVVGSGRADGAGLFDRSGQSDPLCQSPADQCL